MYAIRSYYGFRMNELSVKKWLIKTVLANCQKGREKMDGIMICEKCDSVYLSGTSRCPVCGQPDSYNFV